MARLEFPDYLEAIRRESARFRGVLAACDPNARVPSCPDWTAEDLLWHLADVQDYWGAVIDARPKDPGDDVIPGRPDGFDAVLARYDEGTAHLIAALESADPSEPAATWKKDDQSVAFIYRRQAHEALIHRLDAELAAGEVTALDPLLASDGVEEVLDVMYGGLPAWGTWTPLDHFVRIDCTDTDQQVWVQIGQFSGTDPDEIDHHEDDIHVVADPGVDPDVVVEGLAGALDAWLWRRTDSDGIHIAGDRKVYDHFRAAVRHPIN